MLDRARSEVRRNEERSEALPGQHVLKARVLTARNPIELKSGSTADGRARVTPFENQPEKRVKFGLTSSHRHVSVSRHVESSDPKQGFLRSECLNSLFPRTIR